MAEDLQPRASNLWKTIGKSCKGKVRFIRSQEEVWEKCCEQSFWKRSVQ